MFKAFYIVNESHMTVTECNVPTASVLDRRLVEAAYFKDSYRVPLTRPHATPVDIFFGIFGHHPMSLKIMLIVRNRIAALCGLQVPTVADILHPEIKSSYAIGDKIGPWPIFSMTDSELVAGHDDKHLDFRLSVLREMDGGRASVVVSTICTVHNAYGKVYLFFIVPFHKWGVKRIMSDAVVAGRL